MMRVMDDHDANSGNDDDDSCDGDDSYPSHTACLHFTMVPNQSVPHINQISLKKNTQPESTGFFSI